MEVDAEFHSQAICQLEGVLQRGRGRSGEIRGVRDTMNEGLTESTDLDSWELAEGREPVGL